VRYLAKGTEVLSEEALSEALKAALPTEGGELMATLAEKWFSQGEKEGLLSGIETGLELKFGKEGLKKLLPEIRGIRDLNVLMSLNSGLLTAESLDELREILI